ncbi:MAG: hypothetical protein ACRDTQ_20220, partial [Micromonosporaceae bacterium]
MTGWQRTRAVLNWVNLSTVAGLLLAKVGGAHLRRGPYGLLVADGYQLSAPKQPCFTIGNLVICHRTAEWLLDPERTRLLRHEAKHASQYAVLGLLFFPLYGLASLWSWLLTGGYGSHNWFERHADLADGGYVPRPLRGWAAR